MTTEYFTDFNTTIFYDPHDDFQSIVALVLDRPQLVESGIKNYIDRTGKWPGQPCVTCAERATAAAERASSTGVAAPQPYLSPNALLFRSNLPESDADMVAELYKLRKRGYQNIMVFTYASAPTSCPHAALKLSGGSCPVNGGQEDGEGATSVEGATDAGEALSTAPETELGQSTTTPTLETPAEGGTGSEGAAESIAAESVSPAAICHPWSFVDASSFFDSVDLSPGLVIVSLMQRLLVAFCDYETAGVTRSAGAAFVEGLQLSKKSVLGMCKDLIHSWVGAFDKMDSITAQGKAARKIKKTISREFAAHGQRTTIMEGDVLRNVTVIDTARLHKYGFLLADTGALSECSGLSSDEFGTAVAAALSAEESDDTSTATSDGYTSSTDMSSGDSDKTSSADDSSAHDADCLSCSSDGEIASDSPGQECAEDVNTAATAAPEDGPNVAVSGSVGAL